MELSKPPNNLGFHLEIKRMMVRMGWNGVVPGHLLEFMSNMEKKTGSKKTGERHKHGLVHPGQGWPSLCCPWTVHLAKQKLCYPPFFLSLLPSSASCSPIPISPPLPWRHSSKEPVYPGKLKGVGILQVSTFSQFSE